MRSHYLFALLAIATTAAAAHAAPPIDYTDQQPNTWRLISPREGQPIPRWQWEGSADLDPHNDVWVHHGGHDGGPQGFATFRMDMKTGNWRQMFPNTAPPGVCCVDESNVFDPANRVFVRFPGASMGHGWQWSRSVRMKGSEAWVYHVDANRWVNMRPGPVKPHKKYSREVLGSLNSTAEYDPVHEVALSFGGQTTGGGSDALYAYDAYSNTLSKIETENRPGRRDGSGLAYDSANDCLVMFGSQYGNDEKTWIYRYETNKWEGHALDPHPPGAKGKKTYSTIPRMAYDPVNKVVVCVVWLNGPHETWMLDVAKLKWKKMDPAAEPPDSRSRTRNMGYDPNRGLILLEQERTEGHQPQLWAYRVGEKPANPPIAYNLRVTTDKDGAMLTWNPPAGTTQDVYRAEGTLPFKLKFKKVAGSAKPPFVDRNVEAGKTYFYRVKTPSTEGEVIGSNLARTAPRASLEPVVSVHALGKIEVHWNAHPADDVAGYNVYRALATVNCVTDKGKGGKWSNNGPGYEQPTPMSVSELADWQKVNDKPVAGTSLVDTGTTLADPSEASNGYRYKVFAYMVRAVNKLGVESGDSPYALTLPSAPQDVMLRETADGYELKWSANPEKAVAGYLVYELPGQYSTARRVTDEPVTATQYAGQAKGRKRYFIVAVDKLGQEGEPSMPVWFGHSYKGFYEGDWHQ